MQRCSLSLRTNANVCHSSFGRPILLSSSVKTPSSLVSFSSTQCVGGTQSAVATSSHFPLFRRRYSSSVSPATTEQVEIDPTTTPFTTDEDEIALMPKEIVRELDKHIIGQQDAKKAVAVALRNRWRRKKLSKEQAAEIVPKNILMIGPTGVGKTEIARRVAKLSQAPFIKVEATKFTEVGFHGRDVDQIIRDLVEVAIHDFTNRYREREKARVKGAVEEQLLNLLVGQESLADTRETFRGMLARKELEGRHVELEVPLKAGPGRLGFEPNIGGISISDMFVTLEKLGVGGKKVKRKMTVAEARPYLEEMELEKVMNKDTIIKRAVESVESNGIVFIDEIDKICTGERDRHGADASSEGVQRDLLPLIEGTTISTKHGNIDTSKILFVASGAFHSVKPSDLLAELQGRLPIRVQLKPLSRDDLYAILTETEFNQIEQSKALLKTEGIDLQITPEAVKEIAKLTSEINETVQNIGARRLHTVIERIIEDISYECPSGTTVVIDTPEVRKRLSDLLLKSDLTRYVL